MILACLLEYQSSGGSFANESRSNPSESARSETRAPDGSAAATTKDGSVADKAMEDTWAAGQSEKDGKPMFVRANLSIRDKAPVADYPVQVMISAKFDKPGPHGLPSEAELPELEKFEEETSKVLTQDKLCIFALVVTHDGLRDYFFYCKNVPVLQDRLKLIVERRGLDRCGVDARLEPEWEIYRALARPFK